MQRDHVYLASSSPRRLSLLRQIGISPVVVPAAVDESALPGESPRRMVVRLAEAKARAALSRLGPMQHAGLVLAADTAVIVDEHVLGKPADAAEAEAMLRLLRGRSHEVLTGVCLLRIDDGRQTVFVAATAVRFRDFDDAMLRAYVASDEPMDKAGAYGIQGRGALLVEGITGSWSNVVGLPLELLPQAGERLDFEWASLTADPAPPDPVY
jgi:septum formation protein